MPGVPDDGRLVRLRTYRLAPRKARLECVGDELVLRLPTYFGRRAWRVPIAEVNVVDMTAPQTVVRRTESVYAEPVSVPYLFTTGPNTRPTTLLLFTTPQRVPPLRLVTAIAPNSSLPFGYRASRSATGARLDGVFLRAVDPAGAVARLVMAGARPIDDPVGWLQTHREMIADPVKAAAIVSSTKRAGTLHKVAAALLMVTLVTARWATNHDGPLWLWPLVAITGASTVVLWLMARRTARLTPPPGNPVLGEQPNERPH